MVEEPTQEGIATPELFPGDTGALPLQLRLTLVKLLVGPFIDEESTHWHIVLQEEAILRSRLAELFLDLMIDRDRKVAFTRQAETGEFEAPVILRTAKLSFLDSVLVLQLRGSLIEAESRNERAVVDATELYEHLEVYASDVTDRVKGMSRINKSIEKMRANSILKPIRGSEGRYEISPALRLLFTANDVEALSKVYRKVAAGEAVTVEDLDATEVADESA
jgi:hypothetical protein